MCTLVLVCGAFVLVLRVVDGFVDDGVIAVCCFLPPIDVPIFPLLKDSLSGVIVTMNE